MKSRTALWWASVRYPLGALVAWASTAVGLISGTGAIVAGLYTSQGARDAIWAIALTAIAIVSFSAFAFQHMRRSRAQAVADTLSQQAHASNILRDTRSFLRLHALEKRQNGGVVSSDVLGRARSRIQDVLTTYSDIFSSTTGTRCRLCIKLVRTRLDENSENIPNVNNFFLYTLARDSHSADENKKHDQKRAREYLDPLKDNSDFVRLWSSDIADEGVFFSQDLRNEEKYETSSLNYRRNIDGNPNQNNNIPWPLWYVSTIVWPIRQESNEALGITDSTQHGFLTVDNRVPSAFDRDVHVAMGRMLSNALFPILDLYTELLD